VLSEVIAVVLAVLNGVLALYLLKQAKILLKTEPLWLNDFVEDKKISLMESLVEENSEGASFLDAVAQKFGQVYAWVCWLKKAVRCVITR
jgi:hypothetical protein